MSIEYLRRLFGRGRSEAGREERGKQPVPPFVMPSTPEARLEALVGRWKINEYYMTKSIIGPVGVHTPEDVRRLGMRYEDIYQEVPPQVILQTFLPESLVTLLLNSDFKLHYRNGNAYSEYSPQKNVAEVKSANDTLHEIGHALWYMLIPQEESEQKNAVIASLNADSSQRSVLSPDQIPTMHKVYAALVGAHSGQFLLEHHSEPRMNDLEEHFARTCNSLMKGNPIQVLPTATASIEDVLGFYRERHVIDERFKNFYRRSIQQIYKNKGLIKTSVEGMQEDPITTELVNQVESLKRSPK